MAGDSVFDLIRLRKATLVPLNTVFLWLDTYSTDFEKFKDQFCAETSTMSCNWQFYDTKDKGYDFIKQADAQQNIVVISSGRMFADILNDLHDLRQLHSIYIYCNKKEKYEPWKDNYRKICGIFDDPVQLFDQMCYNLDEEARRSQLNIDITNGTKSKVRTTAVKIHCLVKNEIKSYYQPSISWCPWQVRGCTTTALPIKGQGTIEVWQHKSVPFELRISNKLDPNDNAANSYAIVLTVNVDKAQLGLVNAQCGHTLRALDNTQESHEVLQADDSSWHCYWLTFYGEYRMIQYGIGEIRPRFKILEVHPHECDKISINNISYLHMKVSNDLNNKPTEYFKDNFRIFIGTEPVIFDPPLLVISPIEFSPTHPANIKGVLAPLLRNPCRNLYVEVIDFSLNAESFPNFIETVEQSIRNPAGWCYKKLKEKQNHFGKSRVEASYLCIALDQLENDKPICPCLIKIWPPGHHSPVHNHGDAYGIIRVLHGKILIKFFPFLSVNLRQDSLMEQLFVENQVTWMIPKLNQTYQMKNLDMDVSCCITIHCYQHKTDDAIFCERFDFITNDGHRIEHYDCLPDTNYLTFKNMMLMESKGESTA
ncbi:unnamed protein product [Rotaria socialis]|uniref:Cysteine dioxygenase n=1 Tax=Rotaria socialis TaxID=392032 RepID=A0A818ML08_9BILA|nr:unnamed protein product [Rotaria socialis]